MWGYDVTGGFRYGKLHERLSHAEALAYFPTLDADRLTEAYVYYDARRRRCPAHAGDRPYRGRARRRTRQLRAGAFVHARSVGAPRRCRGRGPRGQHRRSGAGGRQCLRSVERPCARLRPRAAPALLRPAKGIHITVPRSLVRNEIAAVLPVPDDKRTVFVVPWGDFTYVGTTDTDYEGDIDDPRCSDDDVAYLLRTINASLASPITHDDIVGAWAGLRPLVAATHNSRGRTSDLSRRHLVHVANSGLITVTGGKLTTYRRMAEDTIDHARRLLGLHGHRCLTSRVPLVGADGFAARPPRAILPNVSAVKPTWCCASPRMRGWHGR